MMLIMLLMASVYDIIKGIVPNLLTYSGIFIGLLGGLTERETTGFLHLTGMLAGGGLFFLIWVLKGVGGGDVKLMAAVGAFVGWPAVVDAVFFTALWGGVLALMFVVWKKAPVVIENGQEKVQPRMKQKMPYAVAITLGTLTPQALAFFLR